MPAALYGTHTNKMTSIDWRWFKEGLHDMFTNRYHNTSSVSSMIEQLEWTTLQERRTLSRLLMMYKLKNNIVRVDASSKLIPNERPSRNNNEQALHIPSCKTTARQDSFYPRTIKEWNGVRSLFRQPIAPTAHYSDSPLLRQPISPTTVNSVKSSIIILKPVVFLLYLTEDWL